MNMVHSSALTFISRVSNIESYNSENVGLEDYNNISEGIFTCFTTPSIKLPQGRRNWKIISKFNALLKQSALS